MSENPIADEQDFIGMESHVVPGLDPGEDCYAKKTITLNFSDLSLGKVEDRLLEQIKKKNDWEALKEQGDYRTFFKGYCRSKAGRQTEHEGEGRCKWHGGDTSKVDTAGAPKHNQNGATHGLNADPHHYFESLDPERKEFVRNVSAAIQDRIRQNVGEEPDYLDKVLIRRIAIKLDMVAKASNYVENVSGLIQVITTEHGSHEDKAPLLEEIRRFDDSIFKNLKDLGVMRDPESKKADALDSWRDFVESGNTSKHTPNQHTGGN